jgi:hypothetical protein
VIDQGFNRLSVFGSPLFESLPCLLRNARNTSLAHGRALRSTSGVEIASQLSLSAGHLWKHLVGWHEPGLGCWRRIYVHVRRAPGAVSVGHEVGAIWTRRNGRYRCQQQQRHRSDKGKFVHWIHSESRASATMIPTLRREPGLVSAYSRWASLTRKQRPHHPDPGERARRQGPAPRPRRSMQAALALHSALSRPRCSMPVAVLIEVSIDLRIR